MLPRNNKSNRGRGRAQIRQRTLKSDVESFGEGVGRVSPNIRFGETSKLARLTRLTHLDSASRLRTLDGGGFEIDTVVDKQRHQISLSIYVGCHKYPEFPEIMGKYRNGSYSLICTSEIF